MFENIDKIKIEIEELLKEDGYYLYSLNYKKIKKDNVLEIIVDKDTDISLDDITLISNKISLKLDSLTENEDSSYILDVSSLGIEKPIKLNKIDSYLNKYIWIHLSHPYEGKNILEGDLIEVSDEEIILAIKIKSRIKKVKLLKKNIDKARLAIKF